MTKETNFEHPPKGHLALLAYDSVNDRWQAVHVDDSGNLQVDITAIVDGQIHLYAWDGDSWEKVTIDAAGHLQVDVAAAVDLNVQNLHYDGSAWVKSNLLWGYNDALHDQAIDNNVSAGTDSVDGSAVPANELWVVQRIISHWAGTSCTKTLVILVSDSTQHVLDADFSPASGVYLITEGPLVMKEGDFLRLTGEGLTAGDDLRIYWHGYKMDIDM